MLCTKLSGSLPVAYPVPQKIPIQLLQKFQSFCLKDLQCTGYRKLAKQPFKKIYLVARRLCAKLSLCYIECGYLEGWIMGSNQ